MVLQDGGKNVGFQGVESAGIAKEAGDVDEHVPVKGLELRRIALKMFHIFVEPVDFVNDHAALNAAEDGALPVMSEVHASGFSQKLEDQGQSSVFRGGDIGGFGARQIGVTGNARKFVGDGSWGKNIVNAACSDSAYGHTGIFCRSFVLGEGHAAVSLNFREACGSVRA